MPGIGKIPLEEGMATHSSILAWRIPQTEEPGRLQSMGLQKVGHKRLSRAQYSPGGKQTNKKPKPKLCSSSVYDNMAKPVKPELVPSLGLFTLFP